MHTIRIYQEIHMAIISALAVDFTEPSVIVIPRKLEWSTTVVLHIRLWREGRCDSKILLVVTRCSTCSWLWLSAFPFCDMDQCLTPFLQQLAFSIFITDFSIRIVISCLLIKVCKHDSKFSLTGFIFAPTRKLRSYLSTKRWILAYCL